MNERTQLANLTCENCGATLIVHGQLVKCIYCGSTYQIAGRLNQFKSRSVDDHSVPQAVVNIAKEISQGK